MRIQLTCEKALAAGYYYHQAIELADVDLAMIAKHAFSNSASVHYIERKK